MHQVHGADVVVIDEPWPAGAPEVDALVTRSRGLVLAVLVADCVPVLLADPAAGVVAVVHAGRPGLVAGVVPATVAAMRDQGAAQITARLGPSVCGGCYEVPDWMRDEVAAVVPAARATTFLGTPAVDVAAGVAAQLHAAGVGAARVPGCTVEDPALYSYRRDRTTGRFAGLAWLAAE
jgi:polyphenol oxidase